MTTMTEGKLLIRRMHNCEAQMRRYFRRKEAIIAYLGGKCNKCGGTEALECDHIDPTNKSFTIGKLWSLSWDKLLEELKKCQLLCYGCHKEKHGERIFS